MCLINVTTSDFKSPNQIVNRVKNLIEQFDNIDVVVELPQRCIPRYREELMELLDKENLPYNIVGRVNNGIVLTVSKGSGRKKRGVHLYDGPYETFVRGLHD